MIKLRIDVKEHDNYTYKNNCTVQWTCFMLLCAAWIDFPHMYTCDNYALKLVKSTVADIIHVPCYNVICVFQVFITRKIIFKTTVIDTFLAS